jgi:hypothetical protein
MRRLSTLLAAAALVVAATTAYAQKSTSDGINEYRAMLQDGNPADLFEAKGEDLWKQARGPKKASLTQCDLGKGPGVVKGAWVELPRYFADTQKVQDLESRLLYCMETLQGFDAVRLMARASKPPSPPWPHGWRPSLKVCALTYPKPMLKKNACSTWAKSCFTFALEPMISPVPPVMLKMGNAFDCKTCPISPPKLVLSLALVHGLPIASPTGKCGACNCG